MNKVLIIKDKGISEECLALTKNILKMGFDYESEVSDLNLQNIITYDFARAQYDADSALDNLFFLKGTLTGIDRVVGLLSEGMYQKESNHLYGLAYTNGKNTAILSIKRISGGRPIAKCWERFYKVFVHEFLHTYRIRHCDNKCIMHAVSGPYAELDKKLDDLALEPCGWCKDRYSQMRAAEATGMVDKLIYRWQEEEAIKELIRRFEEAEAARRARIKADLERMFDLMYR